VAVLALGAADLGAELWLDPHPDGQELLYARSKLVADSAAAAIRPPIDSVQLDVADQDVLAAEAALGRRIGLRGKLCIHPAQIAVVNEAFAPTRMETQWASEVVAAHDAAALAGRGATLVRGALVDEAIVRRARMILTAVDVRGEESTWGGITPASTHSVKGG
jgi:citrate lyase subunit beta/citryl-CoA lyase